VLQQSLQGCEVLLKGHKVRSGGVIAFMLNGHANCGELYKSVGVCVCECVCVCVCAYVFMCV
jgi:hypothetical protein